MEIDVSLDDLLIFSDEFDSTTKFGTLEDTIVFNETIDSHTYAVSFSDSVQFIDRIILPGGAVFDRTLSDSLTFDDEFVKGRNYASFSDMLILMDWLVGPEYNQLRDSLTFIETMDGWGGPALVEVLTFVDSLNYTVIANHPVTDSLTFTDGFTGYINDPWRPIYPIVEATP